jgi:hypothetical protein
MRTFSRPRVLATVTAGFAIAAAMAACQPARAQQGSTIVTYKPLPKFSVRVGGYFPANSTVRKNVGSAMFCCGVDWVVSRQGASTNSFISADIIDRTSGANQLRMIPVTYGSLHYSNVASNTRTYAGWGLGVYFTSLNVPNNIGFQETHNETLFGGYLNLGVETQDNLFLDLRYHITTTSGPANPGGLEATAGIRF